MNTDDLKEKLQSGWIKLYRTSTEHWIFPKNKPLTQFEAWIVMLLEVNHTDNKIQYGYDIIECKRGDSLNSLDRWSQIFNWHKSKVRRFFKMLEKDSMIVLNECKKTTHITISNYDKYQGERHESETQVKRKRHASETQATPNKNDKNKKNINKSFNPPTVEEIKNYTLEKGYNINADKVFAYYNESNWVDSKGNKVKNWKQKVLSVWCKDENKIKKDSIEELYINHYSENRDNLNIEKYAKFIRLKKDVLYKLDNIITLDEFNKLGINGNFNKIIISFQNYGSNKTEFLTNLSEHVRKY